MAPEQSFHLPNREMAYQEIYKLDIHDDFGPRVMALAKRTEQLEHQGVIHGYFERLLLYELERRRSWFQVVIDRTKPRLNGIPFHLLTPSALQRVHGPGRFIEWKDMLQVIKGKSVIFDKGSYRHIPTPAHISYLIRGFEHNYDASTINIVMFEPQENVEIYKGELPILPDDLRIAFLRHIPTVHFVTQVPQWNGREPTEFWGDVNISLLSRAASITEMTEQGDEFSMKKKRAWHFDLDKTTMILPHSYEPDYMLMRTRDWDKQCSGHEAFVTITKEFLLDR